MQAQSLNHHHVGELLCDEETARLRIAQFLPHPLQRPAHRRLLRFFADMHDRRQFRQKNIGMLTGKGEVPADKQAIPAAIARGDTTIQRERKNRPGIRRGQCQVTCKAGSKATRQEKTISRRKPHRLGNTFHGEPALAGDDRIAFDACMLWEFDSEVSTQIKTTGPVSTRFQQ